VANGILGRRFYPLHTIPPQGHTEQFGRRRQGFIVDLPPGQGKSYLSLHVGHDFL